MFHHSLALAIAATTIATPTVAEITRAAGSSLHYEDVGRRIPATVGQEFQIILPSTLTSTHHWVVRPRPDFRLVKPPYVGADPDHPARDATIIHVVMAQQGNTIVEVATVPMGGGGGAASSVLKYRFSVSR